MNTRALLYGRETRGALRATYFIPTRHMARTRNRVLPIILVSL